MVAIVTGIVFGLAPALQASRVDLNSALKESGSRSGARRHNRTRRILIASEVAIAFVLLTGAGLLIRTLAALHHVAPGFDTHHVLTMETALDGSRYARNGSIAETLKRCEERIMRILGVEAVAEAPSVPLESSIGMTFRIAGRPRDDAGAPPVVLIDETMARAYWPNGDPVGQRPTSENSASSRKPETPPTSRCRR